MVQDKSLIESAREQTEAGRRLREEEAAQAAQKANDDLQASLDEAVRLAERDFKTVPQVVAESAKRGENSALISWRALRESYAYQDAWATRLIELLTAEGFSASKEFWTDPAGGGSDPLYVTDQHHFGVKFTW